MVSPSTPPDATDRRPADRDPAETESTDRESTNTETTADEQAERDAPPRSSSRRRVLAGIGALGANVGGAAGIAAADGVTGGVGPGSAPAGSDAVDDGDPTVGARTPPEIEPTGDVGFRGAAEAVVDDDGTTVYCSLVDGFGVVDASDPANPEVRYEERELTHDGDGPMESIFDVKVSGDRLLVSGPNGFAQDFAGFFLYDVSDPASPERVAFHETAFGPHNSFIDGDHVYLTRGSSQSPTMIYDVADDDPDEVARWAAGDADDAWTDVSRNYRQTHDIYVQDDTLFVAYWDAGTWMVDVSDPANPSAIGHVGGHDPDYLADLQGLSPEFRELPGNSHYVQPNADASALFVGKEAWDDDETDRNGGPGGIECWDLTGDEPALETVLRPPEPDPDAGEDPEAQWTSHNFGIDGDRLYTSWYGGGVRVYDVSDLAAPQLLGAWREPASTSFWTAKPLASGFVATSYLNPQNSREEWQRGEGAVVYTFPDPDDADAESAPTMTRREFPEPEDEDGGGETTATATTSPTTAADDDGESTATEPPTTAVTDPPATTTAASDGTETDAEGSGSIPGFGALTAIAGGGLGLWRLWGRDGED